MQDVTKVEMQENPLWPNAIGNLELMSGHDEAKELTPCGKCRILCGGESVVVAMTLLGLGGGNIYIYLEYNIFQLQFTFPQYSI